MWEAMEVRIKDGRSKANQEIARLMGGFFSKAKKDLDDLINIFYSTKGNKMVEEIANLNDMFDSVRDNYATLIIDTNDILDSK